MGTAKPLASPLPKYTHKKEPYVSLQTLSVRFKANDYIPGGKEMRDATHGADCTISLLRKS
jgi:hypothetical protein